MPARLIAQDNSVCILCHVPGYFLKVQSHRLHVAPWHDDRRALAMCWTYGSVGERHALVGAVVLAVQPMKFLKNL